MELVSRVAGRGERLYGFVFLERRQFNHIHAIEHFLAVTSGARM